MSFKDLRLWMVALTAMAVSINGISQSKGKITRKDYPKEIGQEPQNIEVSYVAWACACPNWLPKSVSNQPGFDTTDNSNDCIFLEAAEGAEKIPLVFHTGGRGTSIKLTGSYYTDKGISRDYIQPTSEIPAHSKVFRYTYFEPLGFPSMEFQELSFSNLQELLDFGSYRKVKAYYEEASREIPIALEISMLDLAMDGKDFFLFNLLGREYPLSRLINEDAVSPENVLNWALFYAAYERRKESISTFESGFKRFSDSALLYHGMGKMYAAAENHQWAYEAYTKAIQLAKAQNDPALKTYQADLKNLKKELGIE